MHKCECKHKVVKYCLNCKNIYCKSCKQEWFDACTQSHRQPWDWPYSFTSNEISLPKHWDVIPNTASPLPIMPTVICRH
jgi:hypothetical protein